MTADLGVLCVQYSSPWKRAHKTKASSREFVLFLSLYMYKFSASCIVMVDM
jgi:hypothetical protein